MYNYYCLKGCALVTVRCNVKLSTCFTRKYKAILRENPAIYQKSIRALFQAPLHFISVYFKNINIYFAKAFILFVVIQIDSNEELEVLSVISSNVDSAGPYRLVPSTHITFIGRQYRFVFCLDISPSLATVVRVNVLNVSVH